MKIIQSLNHLCLEGFLVVRDCSFLIDHSDLFHTLQLIRLPSFFLQWLIADYITSTLLESSNSRHQKEYEDLQNYNSFQFSLISFPVRLILFLIASYDSDLYQGLCVIMKGIYSNSSMLDFFNPFISSHATWHL